MNEHGFKDHETGMKTPNISETTYGTVQDGKAASPCLLHTSAGGTNGRRLSFVGKLQILSHDSLHIRPILGANSLDYPLEKALVVQPSAQ